jgi:hypothetical protein
MQFWEKYVEGVSPPPQIFDPGQWIPTPPSSWDTGIGAYKNCTSDLELVSVASISGAIDTIVFNIQFEVVDSPIPTAKFLFENQAQTEGSIRDIDSYSIGVHNIVHSISVGSANWDGHVTFRIILVDPCQVIIKSITFSYKTASGDDGDSGQAPPNEYSIRVDPIGPLDLCNSPGGEIITFSSFNFLDAYAGRFKISYLSESGYKPIYYSFVNEDEVTIELPLYDDTIYFASKPYPLVYKEALSVSASLTGGRMLVNPYDKAEALDISGILVSGTLRALVQTYNNNWTPEAIDTSAQLLSGTLQRVVGYVSNSYYSPEAIDTSAQLLSGTLQRVVGYVSNSFYQPEAIDTSAQLLAGTLQVVLAYRSNSYYTPEAINVSAQILGGTLA